MAYTWRKNTFTTRAFKLYFDIFKSDHSMEYYSIKPGYRSDHCIVTAELNSIPFKEGMHCGKSITVFFSDMNYVQKVKKPNNKHMLTTSGERHCRYR